MWGIICGIFGFLFVLSLCVWLWFGWMAKPDPLDPKSQEKIDTYKTWFLVAMILNGLILMGSLWKWWGSRGGNLQMQAAEKIIELSQNKTAQSSDTVAMATQQCDIMFANDPDKVIAEQYLSMKKSRPMPEVMNLCNNRAKGLTNKNF